MSFINYIPIFIASIVLLIAWTRFRKIILRLIFHTHEIQRILLSNPKESYQTYQKLSNEVLCIIFRILFFRESRTQK